MPEARAMHIDSIMTNFSLQYRNEEMIWTALAPIVPVGKRSDKYFKYAKANSFRLFDDKIGPKSFANEIDWDVATDNYSVKDHALADWVTQEEIDNADTPLEPERDSNEFINMMLDVAQEKRVADLFTAAANYPSGNKVTLAGATQWTGASDNPIKDIQDAIEACFRRANTLWFGVDAWLVYRRLPEVLDAVKAASRFQTNAGGLATQSEVAALFDVEKVVVGRGRYITTKEGQTDTYARIWGKHAGALYVPPGQVGVRTISFAKTFSETRKLTFRSFDEKRGMKGAIYLKTGWNSDEKITASDIAYLIENAVA
jgi:hypothetical protein